VKFKAKAPSLHILSVDLSTEVSPIVGGKEQSEELVNKLIQDYQDDPKSILSTNIFGKTLDELIGDGLRHKATNITPDAQGKMRKTVTRIINESKGGVICILL
jgi:stage IV sporulation protein A